MTSGNLAEEPIVKGWEEIGRLTPIADAYLVHDREIAVRYDDSVAQVRGGRPRLIRRSRGYAPFPVALPRPLPQTLAAGAELKNTFCLTRDANAFLSQHIGDLENLETLEHYEASIDVYRRLFRLEPEVVAYDLHPEYLATKYALALPQAEKVAVQHHHAHVAARLVEHGREEPVIGVSMDGLGYGDDGRLWGGEVLVCDLTGYRRVAHLEELPLPGGAAAITHPWRTALGWSYALLGPEGLERAAALLRRPGAATRRRAGPPSDEEVAALVRQVDLGVNAPLDDELRPPVRRRGRPGRRAPLHQLRGPGGDRARDDGVRAGHGRAPPTPGRSTATPGAPPPVSGAARRTGSPRARRRPAGKRPARPPPRPRRRRSAPRRRSSAWRRCSTASSPTSRRGPRPAPSGRGCTPPSRRSCSTSAAASAPRGGPSAVALAGGVFQNRLLAELVRASARRRPASTCSPPASCPSTTAASRWGRRRSRAILCSSAAGSFADRGASVRRLRPDRPDRHRTSAHVPRPSHAHHRPRRGPRDHRRRGPRAGVQHHAGARRRRRRLRAGARRLRDQRPRRGGGAGDLRPPPRDRRLRRG